MMFFNYIFIDESVNEFLHFEMDQTTKKPSFALTVPSREEARLILRTVKEVYPEMRIYKVKCEIAEKVR
jgi:hypothetical protein